MLDPEPATRDPDAAPGPPDHLENWRTEGGEGAIEGEEAQGHFRLHARLPRPHDRLAVGAIQSQGPQWRTILLSLNTWSAIADPTKYGPKAVVLASTLR
jgi:hypothetical protein